MSLVGRNFGEYYDELTSQERTVVDQQKSIMRDEVGLRRQIELESASDFADMLHVMGIMIGEKKLREKGGGPKLDKFELAVYEKQRAVWFPSAPKRQVAPPTRRITGGGFPHAQFRELCDEEAELRRWVHGVEKKLRSNIERSCSESWYVLTCFQQMYAHELRGRTRLEKEQLEGFTAIRKSVFQLAPPDLFRQMVIERYGVTERELSVHPELTFEETEELRRQELEQQEFEGRKATFQYLHNAYDAYLFMQHHQEICNRMAILEEEACDVFPVFTDCNRESFGVLYYFTPTLALHCASGRTPCLAALAQAHKATMQDRASAALQSFEEAKQAYEEGLVVPFEEQLLMRQREKEAAEAAEREAAAAEAAAEAAAAAAVTAAAAAPAEEAAATKTAAAAGADRASLGSARPGTKQRQSVCFVELNEEPDRPRKHMDQWDRLGVAPEEDEEELFKAFESASSDDAEEEYAY